MATKKKNEFQQATNAELQNKLEDAYQEIFNLRFQRASGKLTNSARFGVVRKDIARIKTILRQRELAGN